MNNHIIAIDFGHGGTDPGAVSRDRTVMESVLIREIGRHLLYDLSIISHGKIAVVCASPLEMDYAEKVSLSDRYNMVNNSDAEIMVSIHVNSSTSARAQGFEVIHYPGSARGLYLARLIHDQLRDGWNGAIMSRRGRPINDLELGRGFHLSMLSKTRPPAVIVEVGFISNTDEVVEIQNNCAAIADCIALGIYEYLTTG